jgi:predicted PurR-regulated permease PerM
VVVTRWAAVVAALVVLWLARQVLAPFVVAAVLAYIFAPLVDTVVARMRAPRLAVVAVLYLLVIGAIALLVRLFAPPLIEDARALGAAGPNIAASVVETLTGGRTLELPGVRLGPEELAGRLDAAVADYLGHPTEALHMVERVFETLLDVVLVLILVFYFLLDGGRIGAYLLHFVPAEHRAHVEVIAARVHVVLGHYVRGQLLLIALMSVVTYIALRALFGLPYASAIAIATGLLEVIPLLGPLLAAGIAGSVALFHGGPAMAGGVLILYIVLRQVEDQVVMPIVVGRAVHLHPVATLFAVLAGGAIAGVLGMFLAVPAAAAIKILLDYLYPPTTPPETASAPAVLADGERPPLSPPQSWGGGEDEDRGAGTRAGSDTAP